MSPYTTQQNWRPRPSAHGEWVASLSSPKFIFFRSVTQTRRPTAWADTSNYQYSPFHSYLIMTKHCNSLPDNSTAARCTSASGHWPSHRGAQLCHNHTHSYSPGSTHRTLTGYKTLNSAVLLFLTCSVYCFGSNFFPHNLTQWFIRCFISVVMLCNVKSDVRMIFHGDLEKCGGRKSLLMWGENFTVCYRLRK